MSQLFKPSMNTLARVSLSCALIVPGALVVGLSSITRSPYNTKVEVPLDQPVPFSHTHHADELGIDCRYCHSSVEKSGFAGIPPSHTCMSCHSQIWTNSPLLEPVRESYEKDIPLVWNRVNKVPDFVYFDHSIHIAKGVNCNVCHGPVQKMQMTWKGKPFFMSWCLDCHRDPGKYIRPKDEVFGLFRKYQESSKGANLTGSEYSLMATAHYKPSKEDQARGRKLVQEYGIKVETLSDCYICHR